MAAIDHSAYAPSSPAMGFGEGIFSTLHRAFRAVRVHIAARQTHNALTNLSTRQLNDIGLEGSDIRALAYEMAQRSIR